MKSNARKNYYRMDLRKITVSIGCFTSKENNLSPSEMLVNADKALYQAKRTGKNKVIIHSK
ncbi:diguanylate cyclase domain-containing protein [Escherichia coli]|uniref:diguanylate cyclase domain-containing protein n=1 Tax=Escherichia coli TaxID=562 RepID=UPI003D9C76C6